MWWRSALVAAAVWVLALHPPTASSWSHGQFLSFAGQNIVADGDSLLCESSGQACLSSPANPESAYDLFVYNASPAYFAHINYGIAGTTPAQICTQALGADQASFVVGKKNIFYIRTASNGTNDTTAFPAALATCFDSLRALGWYVVASTLTSNQVHAANYIGTVSATIRGWGPGLHWDALSDVNLDANLGCELCWQNTTWFADGTHMTPAGYARENSVWLTPTLNGIH